MLNNKGEKVSENIDGKFSGERDISLSWNVSRAAQEVKRAGDWNDVFLTIIRGSSKDRAIHWEDLEGKQSK